MFLLSAVLLQFRQTKSTSFSLKVLFGNEIIHNEKLYNVFKNDYFDVSLILRILILFLLSLCHCEFPINNLQFNTSSNFSSDLHKNLEIFCVVAMVAVNCTEWIESFEYKVIRLFINNQERYWSSYILTLERSSHYSYLRFSAMHMMKHSHLLGNNL